MNMAVYNPAFTGANGSFVYLNSRSQWSGIEDAPKTNYLIYHFPKSEKVALGFTAQNDRGHYHRQGLIITALIWVRGEHKMDGCI